MVRKSTKAATSLSKGRPPVFNSKPRQTMSRKAGRKLITAHHTLEKQRKQAAAHGDAAQEQEIAVQIAALGGLDKYQLASLQGQRRDRGGDTSRVLLEWLAPDVAEKKSRGKGKAAVDASRDVAADAVNGTAPEARPQSTKLRMLEVGALSTQNACAVSGLFDMELIDLHSREPGILEQDFMQRPLPKRKSAQAPGDQDGLFDVISLSLVLNYVPEIAGRGEMLRRTLSFLRAPRTLPPATSANDQSAGTEVDEAQESNNSSGDESPYPCLFLVLPRSCVTNSRYLNDERLLELMTILGYEKIRSKITEKLAYYLWRRLPSPEVRITGRKQPLFTKQKSTQAGAETTLPLY